MAQRPNADEKQKTKQKNAKIENESLRTKSDNCHPERSEGSHAGRNRQRPFRAFSRWPRWMPPQLPPAPLDTRKGYLAAFRMTV